MMSDQGDRAVVRMGSGYYRENPAMDAAWGFDRSGQADVMPFDAAVAIAKEFGPGTEAIRLCELPVPEAEKVLKKADL